jgi:acetyl-CoA carboxylase carboxyltransferase component
MEQETTQCAEKAFDPRLIVAWPSAKIAVMGGSQAAKVLLQIQIGSKKAKGEKVSEKEQEKMLKKIKDRYDNQTKPEYAGARLWIDAIIDPMETRKVISIGIDAANNAPIEKQFNPGVIQT